jgi:hypothetical protein
MRKSSTAILTVAMFCLAASRVSAWSTKEHIQLTRIAIEELVAAPDTPPEMKAWLLRTASNLLDATQEKDYLLTKRIGVYPRGADGIPFWATVPDLVALSEGPGLRQKKVEPFGVPERMLHYIDLEYFTPGTAAPSYVDDLSHKPKLSDFPRDMRDPRYVNGGMLPFRVEDCCKKLTEMIRAGRLDEKPGQFPRDETAVKWAGFLAHYAEDNTQPQHATIDYKSATYFASPRGAPNVHADVEYKLVDDELEDYPKLREEFWQAFEKDLAELHDPIQSDDPWLATLEVCLKSYDSLPLIGHAAAAAYKPSADGTPGPFDADAFFHFRGPVDGKEMSVLEMKAFQMAWAVKRVERLWRRAWDDAKATPTTTPSPRP